MVSNVLALSPRFVTASWASHRRRIGSAQALPTRDSRRKLSCQSPARLPGPLPLPPCGRPWSEGHRLLLRPQRRRQQPGRLSKRRKWWTERTNCRGASAARLNQVLPGGSLFSPVLLAIRYPSKLRSEAKRAKRKRCQLSTSPHTSGLQRGHRLKRT